MKTLSKKDLQKLAIRVLEKNPSDKLVFATTDGNIFTEANKSAAEWHARQNKLKLIELSRPDESEAPSVGSEVVLAIEEMKRPELDIELVKRGLNPKDCANKAECIAAIKECDAAAEVAAKTQSEQAKGTEGADADSLKKESNDAHASKDTPGNEDPASDDAGASDNQE